MEVLSKASTLLMRVGVSDSTLLSSDKRIGELKSKLASKNFDFYAATAEPEPTELHLSFA